MKKYKIIIASVFVLTPVISFAALEGINSILMAIKGLIGLALPTAFGLAVLFFFWSIARFILSEGNPAAKEQNRKFLIWSVIAMFVLISIWGIVQFITVNLLGSQYTNTGPANQPTFTPSLSGSSIQE